MARTVGEATDVGQRRRGTLMASDLSAVHGGAAATSKRTLR